MVPPLERNEYLYELRNHAETVLRERCEHSEVHPPGLAGHESVERGEEQGSFPEGSGNLGTPLGPSFHIPMTQDKSLEDLPSQIDFEWQDSVSPLPTPAPRTTAAAVPSGVEDNEFITISQIAQEAAVHATQQRADEQEAEQEGAEQPEARQDGDNLATNLNG